jgi:hypothetical protein
MKKWVIATIVFFCAVLVVVWVLSEQAHPVMLDIDPAKVDAERGHHKP